MFKLVGYKIVLLFVALLTINLSSAMNLVTPSKLSKASAGSLEDDDVCHEYSTTIESPCGQVIANATDESYFIRQYTSDHTIFTKAHVASNAFTDAQNTGFNMNFDYISGANEGEVTIPMTSPVLFRQNISTETGEPNGWEVSFFVPSKYPTVADVPLPTNTDVTIDEFPQAIKYAVILFGGFAEEADYQTYETKLLDYLKRDGVEVMDCPCYGTVWAGYDSPFVLYNRHNEVMIRVE